MPRGSFSTCWVSVGQVSLVTGCTQAVLGLGTGACTADLQLCGHCLVGSGKVPREGSGLVVDQRVGTGEACHGEGPLSPLSTESLLALPWASAGTCSPQESAQRPASCSPREGQGKEVHLTAASLLAQQGARHLVQTSPPAGPTAGTSSDCWRSLKRP